MAFCTVEDVPLAPLNQLSPCLNTPAHVVAGDGVSQPSAFLWTLRSVHSFLKGESEARGNPTLETIPMLSREEGCLYKHSLLH